MKLRNLGYAVAVVATAAAFVVGSVDIGEAKGKKKKAAAAPAAPAATCWVHVYRRRSIARSRAA